MQKEPIGRIPDGMGKTLLEKESGVWEGKIKEFCRQAGVYDLVWSEIKPLFDEYAATARQEAAAKARGEMIREIEKYMAVYGKEMPDDAERVTWTEGEIRGWNSFRRNIKIFIESIKKAYE